jgi:hypothetical protein
MVLAQRVALVDTRVTAFPERDPMVDLDPRPDTTFDRARRRGPQPRDTLRRVWSPAQARDVEHIDTLGDHGNATASGSKSRTSAARTACCCRTTPTPTTLGS